jgi:glycosyltransferase involved in cell wall biosynthesis
MRLSVIIPARNEFPHVTYTLQVIWDALERGGFDWETILVDNCSDDLTTEFVRDRLWHARGKLKILHCEQPSCWKARNRGMEAATGDILFYFDAHVVICPDLFEKQLEFMRRPWVTALFTPVRHFSDVASAYGYSLGPENRHMHTKFWGSWTKHKQSDEPYRIPMSGTAGMAVRRDFLEWINGWPEHLRIYGGGEQWICLLAWMTGHECWIDPRTYLYHYNGKRGYIHPGRQAELNAPLGGLNGAHLFNKCLVAYALGGHKWWLSVQRHEFKVGWKDQYREAGEAIANEAREAGIPYRKWVEAHATKTLDEVLEEQPWAAPVLSSA